MSVKKSLILLLTFSLLLQISFSVYYSSEIITRSIYYKDLLGKIDKLETEYQKLQAKLASETSLEKLSQYLKDKNHQPIWQHLDLNQP